MMRQALSAGLAVLLTLVVTVGVGMVLDRLGEEARVISSYTALL